MVVAGLHISEEVIMGALLLIIGLLTSFNLILRARAKKMDAEAKRIAAYAKKIEDESEIKVKEAEAALSERLSLANTLNQYGDLLNKQIVINQQQKERTDDAERRWRKRLAIGERRAEQNYRVLSRTQDRHAAELHTHFESRFDGIEKKIDELPTKLQADTKEWIQTVVAEVAAQIAERFAEVTLAQEWYPFPDMSDPEWQAEFVKPLVNKVRLYRRPVSSESSATDVEIPQAGSNMKIIKGRKKGWLVVRRDEGTIGGAFYGWVLEHEVLTGMTAIKRATGEAAAVAMPAPIPAAG